MKQNENFMMMNHDADAIYNSNLNSGGILFYPIHMFRAAESR